MEHLGWVIACVICLIGGYQWLFFRKKLDRALGVQKLTMAALHRLYGGQFVGGCNYRYDAPLCSGSTPLEEMCPPCYGRRVIDNPEAVLDEVLAQKG